MIHADVFLDDLFKLCGKELKSVPEEKCKNIKIRIQDALKDRKPSDTFSVRQLNEVLLLCNERIVSEGFFKFLAGNGNDSIKFEEFSKKVEVFRKLAMLQFGSFRFAYLTQSRKSCKSEIEEEFEMWLRDSSNAQKELSNRLDPILEIEDIKEENLHLLGYLSLDDVPKRRINETKKIGQKNFETYLTYDYVDVYVATSMRQKWEYVSINRLCKDLFEKGKLKKARIRYFNPTLSFHENSIAKSLIEGLMLKRAKCTLYLVQETDTMGKDSEMSATLAQGKPVVAFVPEINVEKRYKELVKITKLNGADEILDRTELIGKSSSKVLSKDEAEKMKKYAESIVKSLRKAPDEDIDHIVDKLAKLVAKGEKVFYDKRADNLINNHPLRFQINLESGVANGVLVARNEKDCSDVIFSLLTNDLDFDILGPGVNSKGKLKVDNLNYRLIENSTGCAFRVVTKDEKLTNSFWNLYKLRGN